MKQTITLFLLIILCFPAFTQMPNTLTNTDKIYGLSKFWQEVNYNFVYLNKIDKEKWETDYQRLIGEVQATKNDYEYYRLLQRFCASLNDGHTNIYFPEAVQEEVYTTYFGEYRIFPQLVDDKVIIVRVNLSKKDEIPMGTEITAVNDMPTEEYIERYVLPYMASSTDYVRKEMAAWRLLSAPKGTNFKLELKLPNGTIKILSLTHTETTEKEVYPPFEEWELMRFKWLENEIAYLELNSFGNAKIDTLFEEKLPELYKAKKLVIDLRRNGGGSTSIGRDILKYLTHDTLLYSSMAQSRLHIPSYKAWGAYTEVADTIGNAWAAQEYLTYHDNFYHVFPMEPDTIRLTAERLVIPTVVLIGHGTASAAEDFLIYADKQAHFTKIGEPTFGSTGQPMLFALPGGGSARICTKKDTYPDGREFVGYGIQPDIFVSKTLEDYLKGRDPALERAIEYLQGK